jgi:hypothetical protein
MSGLFVRRAGGMYRAGCPYMIASGLGAWKPFLQQDVENDAKETRTFTGTDFRAPGKSPCVEQVLRCRGTWRSGTSFNRSGRKATIACTKNSKGLMRSWFSSHRSLLSFEKFSPTGLSLGDMRSAFGPDLMLPILET